MMFVDSHCHLDQLELAPYAGKIDLILEEAWASDIKHILSVGLTLKQSEKVIQIADTFPHVSASIGIHPTEEIDIEYSQFSDLEQMGKLLEVKLVQLGSHPKVVAIGETGLDFYRNSDPEVKSLQIQKFRAHIRAAKQLKKPLIIHTRSAQTETLDVLMEEAAHTVGGVMHCFTETLEMAKSCIDMNFYISFSGIITFKNALTLQTLVQQLPLEKLLIETDAPYLAPVPYRGKSNKPVYVRYVAEKMAELKGEPLSKVADVTTKNYFDLFYLSDRSVYVNTLTR